MSADVDKWQFVFLAGAALFVALQAWRGWRLGVVRQLLSLVIIAAAYAAAFFGGRSLAPLLRPLGFPDQILAIIAGTVLALMVMVAGNIVVSLLFKRTAQQKVGAVRFGYGFFGALIGGLFGLAVVWLAIVSIRVLGTVAETQIATAKRPAESARQTNLHSTPPPPGAFTRGLVHMKQSLGHGATAAMVDRVDPIPDAVYRTLEKVGQMVSNQESVARFLAYPGVKPLAEHPKIVALKSDPQVARDVLASDYVALLRNERIVAAANDPEVAVLLRQFEFQKALDYATRRPEKRANE